MKRGRKHWPCPDRDALRRAYESDQRPGTIARRIGATPQQVRRWLGEIGIELPPSQKRPPYTTPRFRGVALRPDGTRAVTALYTSWNNMKIRCKTKWPGFYRWYGSKGITWCAEWSDFATFRKWALENGFRKGLTLDRIDSTKNYGPDNCRWATREEQTYNLPCVHKLTFGGVTKLLPVWAKELGVTPSLLRSRKTNGWSDEEILTIPHGGTRPGRVRGRRSSSSLG